MIQGTQSLNQIIKNEKNPDINIYLFFYFTGEQFSHSKKCGPLKTASGMQLKTTSR